MNGACELTGNERVLVIRLGAMGDILHALPAVESLKRSFPSVAVDWIAKPRWIPLLEGNPSLRRVIPFDREQGSVWTTAGRLREAGYDLAIDLQGLIQSALVAKFSGAKRVVGYARGACREPLAAMLYSQRVEPSALHIAGKHLEVVRSLGARELSLECILPPGDAEGDLPEEPFVLASPFAGWRSKQWPLSNYAHLARLLAQELGMPLVLSVAESDLARVAELPHVRPHASALSGLIDATRRARAVVGVDSGPLHLAAALAKPGVALFGPTDPARNGPVAGALTVLRDAEAATTYKREEVESESMRRLTPRVVFEALAAAIDAAVRNRGGVVGEPAKKEHVP